MIVTFRIGYVLRFYVVALGQFLLFILVIRASHCDGTVVHPPPSKAFGKVIFLGVSWCLQFMVLCTSSDVLVIALVYIVILLHIFIVVL